MNNAKLPVSVLVEKSEIPDDSLRKIRRLSGPRPVSATLELVLTWLQIVIAVSLAVWFGELWISIPVIIYIATRQNKLGLLTHEQCHQSAFSGMYGNAIMNIFAAYPLLALSVENYGQVHLLHHRSYFTDQDPDFIRKSGEDWEFPMRPWRLAKLFLKDLCGLSTLELIRGKKTDISGTKVLVKNPTPSWVRPTYYIAVIAIITLLGGWDIVLLYWVLPLATVFTAIVRWGAICEHKYNIPGAAIKETTPIIFPSRLESMFLPNLNFGLHTYHHYFPGISFRNLPKVHEIFVSDGLTREAGVFHSNFAYLKFLLRSPKSTSELEMSSG